MLIDGGIQLMKDDHAPAAMTTTGVLIDPLEVLTAQIASRSITRDETWQPDNKRTPSFPFARVSAATRRRFSTWISLGNRRAQETRSEIFGSSWRASSPLKRSTLRP